MGHTMAVALAGGRCLSDAAYRRATRGTRDEGATTTYQPSSPVRPTLSELADGARRPAFAASSSDATLIGQCGSSSIAGTRSAVRLAPARRGKAGAAALPLARRRTQPQRGRGTCFRGMTLLQPTVIDALGFIRSEAGASVGEISQVV